MKVRLILLVALMLMVLIPQQVSAQCRNFYITVKPGIYSPQTNDLQGFDTGFYGEIAAGYQFFKYFAVELGTGYFNTKGTEYFAGTIDGFNVAQRDRFYFDVLPITCTAKLIIPYKRFEFFGLGGVGGYYVWANIKAKGTVNGIPFSERFDDDDLIFGGYLGLGLHYNITPWIFVGAEGKYLWTDKAKINTSSDGVFLDAKFKLDGILATAVLGFRF